jgi:uncharacterized protein
MAFVDPSADYDLDLLEEYLCSPDHPDEVMLLSGLDGYLSAIALAPRLIQPPEWLKGFWGPVVPPLAGPNVPVAVQGAIMGLYKDNVRSLAGDASAFEPIFEFDTDGTLIPEVWADGFMMGIRLRLDDWQPLVEDEEQVVFIGPMLALCTGPDGRYGVDMPEKERRRIVRKAPGAIPLCLEGIRLFWHERGLGASAPPQEQPAPSCKSQWLVARRLARSIDAFAVPANSSKVGRNAPCPCGSGKKYKRCCGA